MEVKEAYRFCPRCGTKFDAGPHFSQCSKCGLTYYFNPKPVQSVILKNQKDELLFVVRAVEPRKGYLDFPGGFVEDGETFEDTARRELEEELGIKIADLKYLSSHIDEYLYQDINYKVTGVTYIAELPIGAVLKPDDDVAAVEFYKLHDIPMDRLAFPSMIEMIQKLKELGA